MLRRCRTGRKARIAIHATAIVFLSLLAGCSLNDNFSAYRSVNLISSQNFSVSGSWTLDDTTGTYMGLSAVPAASAGSLTGLPTADQNSIYRLEIKNLMPDGDFSPDSAGTTPANWSAQGTNSSSATVSVTNAGINGNSLAISIGNSTDCRVSYALSAATALVAGPIVTNATYRLQYDFEVTGSSTLPSSYDNGTTASIFWPTRTSGSGVQYFPLTTSSTPEISGISAPSYLSFGNLPGAAGETPSILLDNIRIVRTDIPLELRLNVPYHDSTGARPDLISGDYQFTIYVKMDPTNTLTGTSPQANRFPATAVSIGVNHAENGTISNNGAPSVHYSTGTDAVNNWNTWTPITCDAGVIQISPPAHPSDSVLQLYVSPTDLVNVLNGPTAGSILVAGPQLQMVNP
ncbi:MAG TPA: hypothetical protein VMW87_00545, partial [Spirochaetia bacterium]|nr:hypothetical protein [Spirochaetia bacterium]